MEVKYKQNTPYGCGMYAVANAINDGSFITPERLEESRKGNNIFQLNTWLVADGKDFVIEPIYKNLLQPLPPKDFAVMPQTEGQCFPFLMDVKSSENVLWHLVGGYVEHDGRVVILDSMRNVPIVTAWNWICLGSIYEYVSGIWGFTPLNNTGEWKMLVKE